MKDHVLQCEERLKKAPRQADLTAAVKRTFEEMSQEFHAECISGCNKGARAYAVISSTDHARLPKHMLRQTTLPEAELPGAFASKPCRSPRHTAR